MKKLEYCFIWLNMTVQITVNGRMGLKCLEKAVNGYKWL